LNVLFLPPSSPVGRFSLFRLVFTEKPFSSSFPSSSNLCERGVSGCAFLPHSALTKGKWTSGVCLFSRSDHIPNFVLLSSAYFMRSAFLVLASEWLFFLGQKQHTNGFFFKTRLGINGRKIQKDGCTRATGLRRCWFTTSLFSILLSSLLDDVVFSK
jgi:hypothetical protein